jgi:hypothetical protein
MHNHLFLFYLSAPATGRLHTPAHDACPELHTGRLFCGAELRRATFRDDVGIQGQQIGRRNHPAAALPSRPLEGRPNWVKLARHSSSGTPSQYGK